MIALLGLPGLYQNWLLAALDPGSKYMQPNATNFETRSDQIDWYKKLETDARSLSHYHCVINTYVDNKNFAWFLYNFFEKTDAVNIKIGSFVEDIDRKAIGTYAFNGLHDHLYRSYNFDRFTDPQYRTNAAIEYFYFLLINQDADFKKTTALTDARFINIEYLDFSNLAVLEKKLSLIKLFDQKHFAAMHDRLLQTNAYYINRYQNFVTKVMNHDKNFDIVETAYLGMLLTQLTGIVYDWFNLDVRNTELSAQWSDVLEAIKRNGNNHV